MHRIRAVAVWSSIEYWGKEQYNRNRYHTTIQQAQIAGIRRICFYYSVIRMQHFM